MRVHHYRPRRIYSELASHAAPAGLLRLPVALTPALTNARVAAGQFNMYKSVQAVAAARNLTTARTSGFRVSFSKKRVPLPVASGRAPASVATNSELVNFDGGNDALTSVL